MNIRNLTVGAAAAFVLVFAGGFLTPQAAYACSPAQELMVQLGSGSGDISFSGLGIPPDQTESVDVNVSGCPAPGGFDFDFNIQSQHFDGMSIKCFGSLMDTVSCSMVSADIAGVMETFDGFGSTEEVSGGNVRLLLDFSMGTLPAMGVISLDVLIGGQGDDRLISPDAPGSAATEPELLNGFTNTLDNTQIFSDGFESGDTSAWSSTSSNGVELQAINGGVRVKGVAAGDGFAYPWSVWASYQHNDFENDFTSTAFDGDTDYLFAGADFNPYENFVAGVALGYETSEVDTTFNAGEQDVDGFSVIPYIGVYLSDYVGTDLNVSANVAIGYTSVDLDQFRTAPGTTTRVTSSTDADRYFFATKLNVGKTIGAWNLTGRTGVTVARQELDGFTESNGNVVTDRRTELGQFDIGGEVGYLWDSFEPYVNGAWQHDYNMTELRTATGPQPSNDSTSFLLGAGFRWFSDSGWSALFEYNTEVSRKDFDSDTYTFTVRGDF